MFFCFIQCLFAATPTVDRFVNDHAAVLTQSETRQLEQKLKGLEKSDSTQIVILTIPKLQNETIEDFAYRVFNQYGIGQKNKDNGVLICLAKEDRKIRIEVGKGLEGQLVDLIASRIVRDYIAPEFKKGEYAQGFDKGVGAIIQVVRGEFKSTAHVPWMDVMFYIALFFLILWMAHRSNRNGSSGHVWYIGGGSPTGGGFSGSGGFSGGGGGSSGGGSSGSF